MDVRVRICVVILLLLPVFAEAGTYYVSPTGAASWANCEDAAGTPGPKSGTAACALSTANTNAAAGDTVYLREGTYTIYEKGIDPANDGSAGNVITFSGYESEVVTITGGVACTPATRNTCAAGAVGLSLGNNSYIKVTKINFTNTRYGFIITGEGHNEISYCTFGPARNLWADILYTGTADDNTGHCVTHDDDDPNKCLYDADGGFPTGESRRVYNATRKSYMYIPVISSSSLIESNSSSDVLRGGDTAEDNKWHAGDTWQITPINVYDPAFCDIGTGYNASTHNYIHHNTIMGSGFFLEVQDGSPLFNIGQDQGAANNNNNNTIEYNHFYNGGHHVFGMNKGFYNVIRRNYIHNESWFSDSAYRGSSSGCAALEGGTCGYRNFILNPDNVDICGNNLVEDNAIAYGDAFGGPHLADGAAGAGTKLASQLNIYRYNDHFGNAEAGLFFGSSTTDVANDNRIYNNTFYRNGYRTGTDVDAQDEYRGAIFFYSSGYTGNVIKNNLMYDHWSETNNLSNSYYWPSITAGNSTANYNANKPPANTITNNYADTGAAYFHVDNPIAEQSDPLFVNSTLATSGAEAIAAWSGYAVTYPNLALGSTSPAKDGGTYLTQVNDADGCDADAADCTALVVDDSTYFQDGTWGSSLATLSPDEICISASADATDLDRCRAISSINYATNTITLASEITFANNEYVWLYKKSDGAQVLYGTKPDYGAHEYNSGSSNALTVTKSGSGVGTVTSDVVGIDCGSTCTYDYDGTVVTLTATATSPSYFSGWSGEGCSDTGTCQVTMSAAKAVTATFSRYGVGTIGAGGQITFGSGGSMTLQ